MYLQVGKLNDTEAKHLGLKQDDPALRVETVFHLTNGQPFDFSKITYNYTQSQFLFKRIIIMGDERKKPLIFEELFMLASFVVVIVIECCDHIFLCPFFPTIRIKI